MNFTSSLILEDEGQPFLLEKRIELLSWIDKEGSISKAAKAVPMSYKAAWDAIDVMNNLASTPIVSREIGGKGGGGTSLTPYGKNLLKTFQFLKEEQKKFLASLSKITDIDSGTIKTLGRLAMQISARNQISGIVDKIVTSDVNSNVIIVPKSGHEIFANVSTSSVENLDIQVGSEVIAIFKSSNVLISTDENIAISARNKIKGKIIEITKNNTNSEVVMDIGEGDSIVSVITTGAVKKLKLEIAKEVFAFIKSSDILIGR